MNAKEFAAKYKVTMSLEETPARPDPNDSFNDMRHWLVTLTTDSKSYSLYYSMGIGYVETRLGTPVDIHIKCKTRSKISMEERNEIIKAHNYRWQRPTIEDVLCALSLDCQGLPDSFESWANNLGFNQDSLKAYETYLECQKQFYELRKFFGKAFEELLTVEED